MITFKVFRTNISEKKLTPAEMKKREEVAKAIHRENPNMPMGMKMAIATKTAKRVAEEEDLDEANEYHKIAAKHLKDMMKKDVTPTQKEYARKMNKRALEAAKMSDPEAAKKHYMGVNEEEELGELNQMTLQRYASKAYKVGMTGGHKSAKHLAGSQRAKEKLKYGDYSEEVEQVDEVVRQAHKVVVTVSEPDHPMVSKRKETVMKRVVVHATDKGDAKAKAESFYKKKGYKVHGSEYHSVQPASTLKTEETLDEVSKKTAVSYIQKKVSQIAKRPGEAMLYTTKMTGKDYESLKRAYKRAGVKEEVKDEYARKIDKYLKKKYNKEEIELDEATQFPSKEHAISYAKEKVKSHKDSDDGIEVYSMPGGGARVVHTMNSQGRQQVLKGGGKKVTTVTREQVEQAPEGEHYCAKHVYSNVHGEGTVLEGMHAEPDENGNIEWYVVEFSAGPRKVYTEKLDIMIAEFHGNHKKKKRMTNG